MLLSKQAGGREVLWSNMSWIENECTTMTHDHWLASRYHSFGIESKR